MSAAPPAAFQCALNCGAQRTQTAKDRRMSTFSAFRRLASLLAGKPQPARPGVPRAIYKPAADGPLGDQDDRLLVFDPDEPADAAFVEDRDGGDGGDSDTAAEPYPNDRRRSGRRNARAGTRVLLIDDSATIVALLRKLLRQNSYETLEAFDAEAGIQLARNEQPDLIFLDIVLPGMNGFAALRALRRDPLTKAIPIIMISGNLAATEQFYVQRIGADDFMKKPFSRSEVFSRIEPLLDAQAVPRRSRERNGTDDAAIEAAATAD